MDRSEVREAQPLDAPVTVIKSDRPTIDKSEQNVDSILTVKWVRVVRLRRDVHRVHKPPGALVSHPGATCSGE